MDKGHILIVDDEESILASLEGILEDEGYNITKANNGEHALDLVRSESPDVVLVDVWMPGIDGIKTLQAVKETNPETEVVVMSGHGSIDTAVAATKLGAFDFIEKPLSMEAVLRIVRSAVQKHRAKVPGPPKTETFFLDGNDKSIVDLRGQLREAAGDLRPIVIFGERGTGKRHAARHVHRCGITSEGPFTPIHCRSFPADGNGRRLKDILGRLRSEVSGGTIYLDGVNGLSEKDRAAVLDALMEDGKMRDRIIVAIDEPGRDMGGASGLSADVARHLQGREVHISPLRDRRGDIILLAGRFLGDAAKKEGREKEFEDEALAAMFQYDWPGNTAELKSAVTRAAYSTSGRGIRMEDLPAKIWGGDTQTLDPDAPTDFKIARQDWERKFLSFHLIRNNWDINSTAKAVSIPLPTFQRKLRTYRLTPPDTTRQNSFGFNQRTIGQSVVLYGRGLHSGLKTGLILEPLPPGSGIRFGSLTVHDTLAAKVDFVESTNHATNLRDGAVVARTIEHLMSAVHAYGISNLLVKLSEEVPAMDGSAAEFCRLIEDAGLEDQVEDLTPIVVDKVYEFGEEGSSEGYIRIEPAEGFSVFYHLDLPAPVGQQSFTYEHTGVESFREQIAPARTFGFIWELEALEEMGLGEGGRWGNFILIDNERVVNTELRFADEFVRHKILDIMGDLYLLGRPLQGKVIAKRSGHRHNVALVRLLTEALL